MNFYEKQCMGIATGKELRCDVKLDSLRMNNIPLTQVYVGWQLGSDNIKCVHRLLCTKMHVNQVFFIHFQRLPERFQKWFSP